VLDIHAKYKKDVTVAGTEPQSVRSCLSTLDQFLCEPHAVLSSCVPTRESLTHRTCRSDKASLREVIGHILGSYFYSVAVLVKKTRRLHFLDHPVQSNIMTVDLP